jgi:hypothetical protein
VSEEVRPATIRLLASTGRRIKERAIATAQKGHISAEHDSSSSFGGRIETEMQALQLQGSSLCQIQKQHGSFARGGGR